MCGAAVWVAGQPLHLKSTCASCHSLNYVSWPRLCRLVGHQGPSYSKPALGRLGSHLQVLPVDKLKHNRKVPWGKEAVEEGNHLEGQWKRGMASGTLQDRSWQATWLPA